MSLPMGCPTLGSLVQGHGEERPPGTKEILPTLWATQDPKATALVVHALLGCPEPWDRICIVGYQGLRGPAS